MRLGIERDGSGIGAEGAVANNGHRYYPSFNVGELNSINTDTGCVCCVDFDQS